jgi:hypothetical protein
LAAAVPLEELVAVAEEAGSDKAAGALLKK